MSRIDELVAQAVPHGVDRLTIGDVTSQSRERNTGGIYSEVRSVTNSAGLARTSDFFDHARTSADTRNYKVVRSGMFVYNPSRINVGSVAWSNESEPVIVSPMYVVFDIESARIIPEYLALFLSSHSGKRQIEGKTEVGARFRLTYDTLATIQLPLPPLEVQKEVVRTLESFTELEAALEAELDARRRQYAHYRDSLLTLSKDSVPWVPMGEIGEFIRGRRFVRTDLVDSGIPAIHYGEIYTAYGVATSETLSHVRGDLAAQLRYARPTDVILAAVGETVEDVGKAVAWLGEVDVAIHDDCFAYRHAMNPKYVSYYLQTELFHSQKARHVSRAKVKRLSARGLSQITIPVPPLEEQEHIAATLDEFDALLNDPSVGLPAELAARRKQYDYYRERLLTFMDAVA